jgi:hypothetical protein
MILPRNLLMSLLCWIVERSGLELDLCDHFVIDALDEQEISEQLQYGRD